MEPGGAYEEEEEDWGQIWNEEKEIGVLGRPLQIRKQNARIQPHQVTKTRPGQSFLSSTAEVSSSADNRLCESLTGSAAISTTGSADTSQSSSEKSSSESRDAQLMSRMMLNDHKAGMEGLDRDKINQIIYQASKGSRYYENELKKEEQVNRRVQEQEVRKSQLTDIMIKQGEMEADEILAELEASRDLRHTIVHVDMDAFYAAVEMKNNPSLQHKPMAVGGSAMLSTSNYLARRFGVRAAMPGFIAKKLCPDLIIVPSSFDKYHEESQAIRSVLRQYDPNMCPMSLDEAYLDIIKHLETRQSLSESERTFSREYTDEELCKCIVKGDDNDSKREKNFSDIKQGNSGIIRDTSESSNSCEVDIETSVKIESKTSNKSNCITDFVSGVPSEEITLKHNPATESTDSDLYSAYQPENITNRIDPAENNPSKEGTIHQPENPAENNPPKEGTIHQSDVKNSLENPPEINPSRRDTILQSDSSCQPNVPVNTTDHQFSDLGDARPAVNERCAVCCCPLPGGVEVVTFGLSAGEAVREMRFRIQKETQLTASAGIAPNMMLAKVCSDKNKPNGQYIIPPTREAVMDFIRDLQIRKISGIGKVSEKMLSGLGVTTCTDLFHQRGLLYHLYSTVSFSYFMRIAAGCGSTSVERDDGRKSMSVERTFPEMWKPAELYKKCYELSESLSDDLKEEQLVGKTVTLKLKTSGYEVRTRAHTLVNYTGEQEVIYSAARDILKLEIQGTQPQPLKLRLMGVRMSNLLSRKELGEQKQETITGLFRKIKTRNSTSPATSPATSPCKQQSSEAQTQGRDASDLIQFTSDKLQKIQQGSVSQTQGRDISDLAHFTSDKLNSSLVTSPAIFPYRQQGSVSQTQERHTSDIPHSTSDELKKLQQDTVSQTQGRDTPNLPHFTTNKHTKESSIQSDSSDKKSELTLRMSSDSDHQPLIGDNHSLPRGQKSDSDCDVIHTLIELADSSSSDSNDHLKNSSNGMPTENVYNDYKFNAGTCILGMKNVNQTSTDLLSSGLGSIEDQNAAIKMENMEKNTVSQGGKTSEIDNRKKSLFGFVSFRKCDWTLTHDSVVYVDLMSSDPDRYTPSGHTNMDRDNNINVTSITKVSSVSQQIGNKSIYSEATAEQSSHQIQSKSTSGFNQDDMSLDYDKPIQEINDYHEDVGTKDIINESNKQNHSDSNESLNNIKPYVHPNINNNLDIADDPLDKPKTYDNEIHPFSSEISCIQGVTYGLSTSDVVRFQDFDCPVCNKLLQFPDVAVFTGHVDECLARKCIEEEEISLSQSRKVLIKTPKSNSRTPKTPFQSPKTPLQNSKKNSQKQQLDKTPKSSKTLRNHFTASIGNTPVKPENDNNSQEFDTGINPQDSKNETETEVQESESMDILVCPVCNAPQRKTDLGLFNQHVDACLNRQAIKEIIQAPESTRNKRPHSGSSATSSSKKPRPEATERTLLRFFNTKNK